MGVSYSCGEVAYWSQTLLRFLCSATYWSCQLTPVLCLPTSTAAYDITLLSGSLTAWLICSKDRKNKNVLKPARCLRFVENLQRTRLSLTDGISIRFDSPKQPFRWKFWKLVEKNSFLSPSIIQNRCVYFMTFFSFKQVCWPNKRLSFAWFWLLFVQHNCYILKERTKV